MTVKVLFIWLKIHLLTVKEKHIYVKYDFVRHIIDEGGVLLEKVHTQKNCANMFTKLDTLACKRGDEREGARY